MLNGNGEGHCAEGEKVLRSWKVGRIEIEPKVFFRNQAV
jgi:hypothetical protein